MDSESLDLNEVLQRVQNDRELLIELFNIFFEDCPGKMSNLKSAVQKKDFNSIRDIAHSMKGASGNISAKKIHNSFFKIEQMGKNSDLNGIDGLIKDLEEQIKELKKITLQVEQDFKKAA